MTATITNVGTPSVVDLTTRLRWLADYLEANGPQVYRSGGFMVMLNTKTLDHYDFSTGEKARARSIPIDKTVSVSSDLVLHGTLSFEPPPKGLRLHRTGNRVFVQWDGKPARVPAKGEWYAKNGWFYKARRGLKKPHFIYNEVTP